MVADHLVALLYDTPIAVLARAPDYRITLRWHEAGIDRWGMRSRILSVSLPLGSPMGSRDMRGLNFFENLLPEGPTLATMARWAGVHQADTFGILTAFGRDCAGAIVVLPEGEMGRDEASVGYLPLSAHDLGDVFRNLDTAPLGADPARGFRPSLPGFQRKVLVGRAADGNWQRPYGGVPSTWILKPDGRHRMAANEATCLRLAGACGVEVPATELLEIDGVAVLAIRRYDRAETADGPVRLHQEDGCQATGTPPGLKYEEQGGPPLRSLAALLRDYGEPLDTAKLLQRVTFNVAVGNADAHAKNFSLLHVPDDVQIARLAPVYDVTSTVALDITDEGGRPVPTDPTMGQRIAGVIDVNQVSEQDIVAEAVTWGLSRGEASTIVHDMLDRILVAVREVDGDDAVRRVIRHRTEKLATSRPMPGR